MPTKETYSQQSARKSRTFLAAFFAFTLSFIATNTLWAAIGASLLLHSGSIYTFSGFGDPTSKPNKETQRKNLDIILVNGKTSEAPKKPQALAQANVDGGGNTEQKIRATSSLPAQKEQKDGDLVQKEARQEREETASEKQILTAKETKKTNAKNEFKTAKKTMNTPSGMDLYADSLSKIAALTAEIDQKTNDVNSRPKLKTLGVSALRTEEAAYLLAWAEKIEKIGTLNYPSEARGKLYGTATIWVVLKKDGSLVTAELRRTSGQKVLDEAALKIVQMGAPYSAIPQSVLGESDHLGFARRLNFTNSDSLLSSASR